MRQQKLMAMITFNPINNAHQHTHGNHLHPELLENPS